MFGPPKSVDGKCNATLHIHDDYGDNHVTMQCQLELGHEGSHQEKYKDRYDEVVVITWDSDYRKDPVKDSR
ncbi:MAG: hypothetical protein DRJ03_01985 [Chloroflexi bacterium]|nr:MAG: hypothetical protein DRJ03_01985 [Chloroflexota bacterium]